MYKTDILVINPGSTTTKIGLFRNLELVFEETLTHDPDKLLAYGTIGAQLPYRAEVIRKILDEKNYDTTLLKAVVGRGGMVIGLSGGGYRVNPALCEAMKSPENPQHASSLGALLAYEIASHRLYTIQLWDANFRKLQRFPAFRGSKDMAVITF